MPKSQKPFTRLPSCLSTLFIFLFATAPLCSAKPVTDQLGRSLVIPEKARRIVSLAPSVTEILYTLGVEDRLVGATQYSNYPQAADSLPKVGSYIRLDIEKIVSLKPDLCIAVKDGNPINIVQKIESFGIPVYAVDPRNLDSIMATIQELGKLLDAKATAEKTVAEMKSKIQNIQTKIADINEHPRVFFQIGISPIVSAGTQTFINNLIVMAGGTNLAQGDTPYPRYSKEEVVSLRPDIMIITSMARKAAFDEVKAEWLQWRDIPAIKNDQIYLVNSDLFDRPSPRLVDALRLLAQLIHPECFDDQKPGGNA